MSEATPTDNSPASLTDRLGGLLRGNRKRLLMQQANMKRMLLALTPVLLSAIYFFGWRVAAVWALVNVVGFATEYITTGQRGKPVSMACFVTCWLYALSLPPTTPYWVAVVGIVVAILFGKEVFGGFGRNFANPAIIGRLFVYVSFPVPLTASFIPAFKGFPGGFAEWSLTAGDLPGPGPLLMPGYTSDFHVLAPGRATGEITLAFGLLDERPGHRRGNLRPQTGAEELLEAMRRRAALRAKG